MEEQENVVGFILTTFEPPPPPKKKATEVTAASAFPYLETSHYVVMFYSAAIKAHKIIRSAENCP